MEPILETLWKLEFARKAAISREQEQRLIKELNFKRQTEEREEKEKRDEERFERVVEQMFATASDIANITATLDSYDTAAVEALMQNEADLKAVREKIDEMLLEAHTLPDGRKVFKTRDGKHVFDESGAELKADEIDPKRIDDRKPRWEDFQDARKEEQRLEQERDDLHEYQGKLDKARDRLDDPNLTKKELDALDKELGNTMPDRVRANLPKSDQGRDLERVEGANAPSRRPVSTVQSSAPSI